MSIAHESLAEPESPASIEPSLLVVGARPGADRDPTVVAASSKGAVIALAFAPADGTPLSRRDRTRLRAVLLGSMPGDCVLTWATAGASLAVGAASGRATVIANELLGTLVAFELADGRRLSVGAGVSGSEDHYSDPKGTARRAELAAAESLVARDHGVVTAAWPRPGRALSSLRERYRRVDPRRRPALLLGASTGLAVVPSFAVYCLVGAAGFNLAGVMFWVVFATLSLTALVNYAEAFTAFDPPQPPAEPARWPSLSVVVSAYLANEVDVVVGTCRALLDQDYPGELQVIVAHNGPSVPELEEELAALAATDARLVVLAVADSTSKAQNVNAALDVAAGEVVGIFDADHRPAPGALRRAGRWLADDTGVDVVQGHCSVRNGEDGWLSAMVAVEFETIYAVGHPGRAALHQFGIFGGSNGFWRTEMLRRLRLRPRMLTEDIDVSMRALLEGARIVSDPGLVSYEMAPTSAKALWHQRTRWAQGWSQVSRAYGRALVGSPVLTTRQRLGALWLTGWRESYAWISAQMVPVIAYQAFVAHQRHIHWFLLFFCVSTIFTSAVGPMQSLFARRLALPHLRRPEARWWWWAYVFVWGAPYGEWRTAVCRAAHLRDVLGDRGWVVTPRTATSAAVPYSTRAFSRPVV